MAGLELKKTYSVVVQSSIVNRKTNRRSGSNDNIEVIDRADAANDSLKGSRTLPRTSRFQSFRSFIRRLNCCGPQKSREDSDDFCGNKNVEDDHHSVGKERGSLTVDHDSIEKLEQKTDRSDTILDKVLDRADSSNQMFAMVGPKYKFRDGSRT